MAGLLEGKVVVITGAAAGIGRAAAVACAREGASVALADVDAGGGDAARSIRDAKGKATFTRCDVTSFAEVEALFARAAEELGPIAGAFLNAGIEGALLPVAEYDEQTFRRVLDVNVVGVWNGLRAALPHMTRNGTGSIVCTSSIAGLIGAGAFSAYVASKHAVLGLVKTAALENAPGGVRVNAICPGVIQTAMLDRISGAQDGVLDVLKASVPMGRVGSAAEVAEAAVWLLSERASYVTGHALTVDGGYVVQ